MSTQCLCPCVGGFGLSNGKASTVVHKVYCLLGSLRGSHPRTQESILRCLQFRKCGMCYGQLCFLGNGHWPGITLRPLAGRPRPASAGGWVACSGPPPTRFGGWVGGLQAGVAECQWALRKGIQSSVYLYMIEKYKNTLFQKEDIDPKGRVCARRPKAGARALPQTRKKQKKKSPISPVFSYHMP